MFIYQRVHHEPCQHRWPPEAMRRSLGPLLCVLALLPMAAWHAGAFVSSPQPGRVGSPGGLSINNCEKYAGWWFGTWLLFCHILRIIIQSDFHIFQTGWNHQPGLIWFNHQTIGLARHGVQYTTKCHDIAILSANMMMNWNSYYTILGRPES